MTHTSRSARRVLLAGAAMLAATWIVAAPPTPPLYDGLTGPAEAYRYLNPPSGYQHTDPPSSASHTLTVSNGTVPAGFIATDEQPPQAQLLVGDGSLLAPPGAHTVTLSIKAVPPPSATVPADLGHIAGNVYTVTATADTGGEATLKRGATPPTVVLRAPPGSGTGSIARSDGSGGAWTGLRTVPLGNNVPDMVAANTTAFGDFAVTVTGAPSTTTGAGSGGSFPVVAVVVPLAVLVVLAGLLVTIRSARRPR